MAKVLVIDDNKQLNDLLKDVLESWEYEVILAEEGRRGVALAQKELPDIVLLDVMLPGLSGYEVCQILKRDTRTANIAIVMMSALSDVEDRIHGFRVGADNFLVKPVNYKELQAIMVKIFKVQAESKSLESSLGVTLAFYNLLKLTTSAACVAHIDNVTQYGEKLGHNMNLNDDGIQKVRIAAILQHLSRIKTNTKQGALQVPAALMEPLKLWSWLKPVLSYLETYSDTADVGLVQLLEEKKLLQIADILLLTNRFVSLIEEEGREDTAILRFKREGEEKGYNKTMVKRLSQIIEDEKVLQSI